MSHSISMMPSQVMRLEQRLTPQLIQSMEILQLPLLALEARIREELEQNPVLEEVENHSAEQPRVAKEDLPATENNLAEAQSFERLERMSRELDLDPGDLPFGRAASSNNGERDAKMDAMANTESRTESLRESLLHQWSLIEDDEQVKRAGEAIIDWMDDDGYLRLESEQRGADDNDHSETPPLILRRTPEETAKLMDELAHSVRPPIDSPTLERALAWIHTLEPAGVGARDLTECLLIQLRALEDVNPLCEVLIRDHLVDLARNRFPQVSKATGRSVEEIRAAMKVIGKLNHHPGLLHRTDHVAKVSPDIIVDYADEGDRYVLRLAKGNSPRLRISPQYREMLADKDLDKQTRDYIKKRVEAAGVIIDAIQYRRQRLLEIARIILERQKEFFDYGPQFLNVLRMRDLAEEFGCDASTISRTVDGKYIQTPRGIFPLRMFFMGGPKEGDDSVTWNSLRAKVKEIVDQEDKRNPLTDDQIAKKLAESLGAPIARRTVAKYRTQLGIPTNRERKTY